MSVSFGRTTRNSFSLRVGKDGPGFSAGLADADSARPERKETVDLLIAVRGAAGKVKMHAVLERLGAGDWHEAHASGRVLVGSDDDLVLALGQDLPAGRLRPERGQAGQIVSVNDDGRGRTGMPVVCAARWTVSRKPAVLPWTGRSLGGHAAR
jgi:hypothetical protein